MRQTKYYINDFAINCHLGSSLEQVKTNLFDHSWKPSPFEVPLLSGRTTVFFNSPSNLEPLPKPFAEFDSRNNRLAETTFRELAPAVKDLVDRYGASRVATVVATSTASVDHFEEQMKQGQGTLTLGEFHFEHMQLGSLTDFTQAYFGLKGLAYAISTACSSSGKVFAEAIRLLDSDLCDAVIVGGSDSYSELTLNGFDSLEAVSTEWTQPFSKNRSGINIGEAASFFVVSREPSSYQLMAVGESSDAYHISSPHPEGLGAEIAIQDALKNANLSASEISYINLHGTGTKKNDSMESELVHRVFGPEVPVSSSKPFVGHTLGAAAAVELTFCLLALEKQQWPRHAVSAQLDDELKPLNFVFAEEASSGSFVMSNSFAFGGSNVSVIVGRV